MRFVDTNVFVYLIEADPVSRLKSQRAWEILQSTDLALSTQVLQEFYTQVTRPNRTSPITAEDARTYVRSFMRYPVQPITSDLVLAAMDAAGRYQISYWDAAIVEAARALRCSILLSEDLQHDQDFDGVRVLNPFL